MKVAEAQSSSPAELPRYSSRDARLCTSMGKLEPVICTPYAFTRYIEGVIVLRAAGKDPVCLFSRS
jgi:hypothetical protein